MQTGRHHTRFRAIAAAVILHTAGAAGQPAASPTPPPCPRSILERLQSISKPFGTSIAIEGSTGVIRIP